MSAPTELYACVLAREFPAQALLRLRPELRNRPCAVLDGEPPQQVVCASNARAQALGAARGMTRVELETLPTIAVLKRSRMEEAAAEAALLSCAGTFSPRIEVCRDISNFCCVLDIAGTEKLLGSPAVLAHALHSQLRVLGVHTSIAVSANFHTALCFARSLSMHRSVHVVRPGEEAEQLAQLSVSVLDLSPEQAETLSLWGIRTLGALAALPEKALVARMGQPGRRLWQMARGEQTHLLLPVEPGLALAEARELDSPVEALDSLLFVLRILLEQIILRAGARALALASVTVTLTLEGAVPLVRTVRPALPTNDCQLWLKLLHLDLEAHPPQAPILALNVCAEPDSTSKIQLGLFSPQMPEPMRLEVTLARIRAIVGEQNAGRIVLDDTHRADAAKVQPFTLQPDSAAKPAALRPRSASRRLRPPESSIVKLQGGRPHSFTFRNRRYNVQHAYGPWCSSGNWWSGCDDSLSAWDSEQWDLIARADDGAQLCCCLLHEAARHAERWHVAALYD